MSDDGPLSDTEWFIQKLAERRAKDADALSEAKADAQRRSKEPFDLARLEAMCDLSASFGSRPSDERLIHNYETKYYVQYPDLMTLKEFAALLEVLGMYR